MNQASVNQPIISGDITGHRCRCGATETVDVVLEHRPHDSRSVRRDCARCGRFVDFPVWYGARTSLLELLGPDGRLLQDPVLNGQLNEDPPVPAAQEGPIERPGNLPAQLDLPIDVRLDPASRSTLPFHAPDSSREAP